MSGFGHFAQDAEELEREIVRRGIALGIDWSDQAAVRVLAREALSCGPASSLEALRSPDRQRRARAELFALAELMLRTMAQSAEFGVHTHGGPVWKAFGAALIEEAAAMKGGGAS
ncbi:hypothetical protein [Pseudothauera rhizosphaerae]|uniref:Uncharacterized protein n=1 Tax=Pseudothauera rhizosphaerae TaxID=2565932 RepID=A0A4V3WAS5_9RHOO|nr:hypothetical protein [Pseudothauera rhizosphaerae]THF60220.1 hypothetical protein E6O51_14965 [Pseudothauera rhizosphaerae]